MRRLHEESFTFLQHIADEGVGIAVLRGANVLVQRENRRQMCASLGEELADEHGMEDRRDRAQGQMGGWRSRRSFTILYEGFLRRKRRHVRRGARDVKEERHGEQTLEQALHVSPFLPVQRDDRETAGNQDLGGAILPFLPVR